MDGVNGQGGVTGQDDPNLDVEVEVEVDGMEDLPMTGLIEIEEPPAYVWSAAIATSVTAAPELAEDLAAVVPADAAGEGQVDDLNGHRPSGYDLANDGGRITHDWPDDDGHDRTAPGHDRSDEPQQDADPETPQEGVWEP